MGYAEDRTIDSLKLALKNAKHDTTRCNILNEIVEAESDDKIWPIYNEQLLKLSEKCASTSSNELLQFYLKHQALALNNVGYIYHSQGNIPKALEFFTKGIDIRKKIGDKKGIANSLNNIGAILNNLGDIARALEYWHQSLKIREELKDNEGVASSLNNIGTIYLEQLESKKALEYYNRSLSIYDYLLKSHTNASKTWGLKQSLAYCLNNIGKIYDDEKNNKMVLSYYQKSLDIKTIINDKPGMAMSYNNLGIIFQRQGEVEKGLQYFERSLQLREESGDLMGISIAYDNIANLLFKEKDINFYKNHDALYYANLALISAKKVGFPQYIRNASSTVKRINKSKGRFKAALEMYELEIQMRDSINNITNKKALIKKQFQYQYEKKAAADSVKNAEEQKVKNAQLTAQQAQLKQERTQRFALYGGLLLVIAFSGFVFNRFKITQKQKVIIESQKHEVDKAYAQLHEKNKEVMDSIHYAARIQRSLITSENYIANQIRRLRKL